MVLLVFTTLMYTWGLDRNGWANSFYSAAVMSGSLDWTAFLFGSSDPNNAISVDKPPLSIWVMSLSVRLFGLNSWSILLPQALMGVISVYLLYRMVRKRFDAATALLSASFMAVIPAATVIFRYNNPDALLTLLMIGIVYVTLEAVDSSRLRWLLLAGVLTGAGFLTKQLQVVLVLPSVGLTYWVFARTSLDRRFMHLLGALGAASVAGGWWLLVVQLTSPANRPFIGGSRNNSVIELTLGYNGLDRLTGEDANSAMSVDVTGTTEKLDAGFQRFLQPEFSGQGGWFLPLAVAGLCVGIWYLWRRQGQPAARALLLACCVWFACAATVLAFMSGIVHPYYVLTAVPPLCFLAAFALVRFLGGLQRLRIRILTGLTLIASMIFAFVSASRSVEEFPWLPVATLSIWGLVLAAVLVRPPSPAVAKTTAALLIVTLFAGPVLWSLNTVLNPHNGAGVVAGPSILGQRSDDRSRASRDTPASSLSLMYGDLPSRALLERLRGTPSSVTWAAAVVGSETAANYQLDLGRAVLPLGGFNGTDPFPTLEQFKILVEEGRVGSVVIQGLPPQTLEGRGESARIVEWVRQRFIAEDIDGAQFFRLAT
ncbi:4-amino-4-deoxy-L-arabinose transferase [Arthrobacter sp. ok909]|uniref:glycosyltransferase family 39 protein n=1 Tax=Arthrobacter sp. ok909 TaxID=1761746 RepID=UPI0008908718|nr:glycosyltransferase family 39 protein [Arthrobacter sp. ok909]SDP37813.1 4-amino-4-deoxy-L-arabinose transferase [Arthrobacter sp. ok909]